MTFAKTAAFGRTRTAKAVGAFAATALAATALAVSVLALGGCRNDLTPGPGDYVKEDGTGTVVMRLGSASQQRTVKPDFGADFGLYILTFNGPGGTVTKEFKPQDWGDGFALKAGNWDITAEGLISNKVVATGTAQVVVEAGKEVTGEIDLYPTQDGDGTFVWNITTSSTGSLSQAQMKIYRLEGEDGNVSPSKPDKTVDFSLGSDTKRDLPSGSYMATATITFTDGSGGTISTVVQVYDNLESRWDREVNSSTSLLSILLGGWHGNQNVWSFDPGFGTAHLKILDEDLGSLLEGFTGNTTAISNMTDIKEIEADWTDFTIRAVPPPKPTETFRLEDILPMVDMSNVIRSFPAGDDETTWNSDAYNSITKVEKVAGDNAINGTPMKFDWNSWDDDGVDVVAGATERYRFKVQIPVADRIELDASSGYDWPENNELKPGSFYFDVVPRGGWAVGNESLKKSMEVVNGGSNISGLKDEGAPGEGKYSFTVDSGATPGADVVFKIRAVRVDGSGIETGDAVEDTVKFTIYKTPPPPPILTTYADKGGMAIYAQDSITVSLTGKNLDINNLDPAAPGAMKIDFGSAARPGALPGNSDLYTDFPVGVTVSGDFTVDNSGNGSGSLLIKGPVAYTTSVLRQITIKLGGATGRYDMNIAPKPEAELTVTQPNPAEVDSADGGTLEFPVTAKYFSGPDGSFQFSTGQSPGPVVRVTPDIPGLVIEGELVNTGSNGSGSGTLKLVIPPGQATPDDYTVKVEFGDTGDNYDDATATFTVKDKVWFDNPILHWPPLDPKPTLWLLKGSNSSNIGNAQEIIRIREPDITQYDLSKISWGSGMASTAKPDQDIYLWIYGNYEQTGKNELVGSIMIPKNTF